MLTCCRCDKCQSERGRGSLTGQEKPCRGQRGCNEITAGRRGLSSRIVKPQEGDPPGSERVGCPNLGRGARCPQVRAGRSPAVRRVADRVPSEGGRAPRSERSSWQSPLREVFPCRRAGVPGRSVVEVRVLQITGEGVSHPSQRVKGGGGPAQEKGDGAWGRGRDATGSERAAGAGEPPAGRHHTWCGLAPGPAGGEASLRVAPGTQRAADFRPARSPRLRATRLPAAPLRDCAPTPTAGFWELWFFVCFFPAAQRAGPVGGAARWEGPRGQCVPPAGRFRRVIPELWPKWKVEAMKKELSFLQLRL